MLRAPGVVMAEAERGNMPPRLVPRYDLAATSGLIERNIQWYIDISSHKQPDPDFASGARWLPKRPGELVIRELVCSRPA